MDEQRIEIEQQREEKDDAEDSPHELPDLAVAHSEVVGGYEKDEGHQRNGPAQQAVNERGRIRRDHRIENHQRHNGQQHNQIASRNAVFPKPDAVDDREHHNPDIEGVVQRQVGDIVLVDEVDRHQQQRRPEIDPVEEATGFHGALHYGERCRRNRAVHGYASLRRSSLQRNDGRWQTSLHTRNP